MIETERDTAQVVSTSAATAALACMRQMGSDAPWIETLRAQARNAPVGSQEQSDLEDDEHVAWLRVRAWVPRLQRALDLLETL
jgi:hypothetical protein